MSKPRPFINQPGLFFITFSCYKRRRLLSPDLAKRIVLGVLGAELAKQPYCRCVGFVVMPDHVHAALRVDVAGGLARFMKQWKQRSSAQIKRRVWPWHPHYAAFLGAGDPVWQAGYFCAAIDGEEGLRARLAYMHANPVRAGLAAAQEDWRFSSAWWYLRGRSVGVPIVPPG